MTLAQKKGSVMKFADDTKLGNIVHTEKNWMIIRNGVAEMRFNSIVQSAMSWIWKLTISDISWELISWQ